jgi:hypothetical protein
MVTIVAYDPDGYLVEFESGHRKILSEDQLAYYECQGLVSNRD